MTMNIGYKDLTDNLRFLTCEPIRVLLVNDYNHTTNSTKPFTENVIGTHQGEKSNPENEDYIRMACEVDEETEITEQMREKARVCAEENKSEQMYVIHGLVDYDEDNYIFHLNGDNSIVAFYPLSVFMGKFPQFEDDDGVTSLCYGIQTDAHEKVTDMLNEYIESHQLSGDAYDFEIWAERSRAEMLVLQFVIYGFIALISVITITNIINTIANSISHRRKEFAMLKSVGLTPNGFKKMLSFESLFYALEGVIIGLPLSVLVCFIINKMMKSLTVPFSMDIKMCIISVCVVFAIIGLTMLYSSAKVRNNNIIEELKQEIN